jgi:hypothetical protein
MSRKYLRQLLNLTLVIIAFVSPELITMGAPNVVARTPQLQVPGDKLASRGIPKMFVWTELPEAAAYDLEIASDALFSSVVVSVDDNIGYRYLVELDFELEPGDYFWRVRAVLPDGSNSEWSTIWSFTIGDGSFDLDSSPPADGTLIEDILPPPPSAGEEGSATPPPPPAARTYSGKIIGAVTSKGLPGTQYQIFEKSSLNQLTAWEHTKNHIQEKMNTETLVPRNNQNSQFWQLQF